MVVLRLILPAEPVPRGLHRQRRFLRHPRLRHHDISTGAIINRQATSVNYPGGVSGIVVDNVSTSGQASSVYFSTQGVVNVGTCNNQRCAVKLTQANLQ